MNTTKAIFGVLKITFGLTGRICTSSLVPLLSLLLMLSVSGAQAAVVFTSLYSFTGGNDGANPEAGLVQGRDGNFYGTTSDWDTHGYGTVFKISTSGVLTTLYAFGTITNANGDPLDGANPLAGLVQGSDGSFYGTTSGFYRGYGTVFTITTNGTLTVLHSFTGGSDGGAPLAGLVEGSDGCFYGTAAVGGTEGRGTVFKISPAGALTSLYSFGGNGAQPEAGLVQGSDGNFYGTTLIDGVHFQPYGFGTVFKISPYGACTVFYSFDNGGGACSMAGLVQGSDGYLYGTTSGSSCSCGYGWGTVFKISPTGALTSLHSFAGGSDGGAPLAGLVQGSDGCFYGTTSSGGITNFNFFTGTYGCGTVFKISTNGVLTTLYAFGSIINASGEALGVQPYAALVQGSDGNFYGTTFDGGKFTNQYGRGNGTVFRLAIVPPPQLSIIPSGPHMILTWPTDYNGISYAGCSLQSTTNLGPSAVWATNSPAPVVINGQNVVTNPITGTQQFYRLSQ